MRHLVYCSLPPASCTTWATSSGTSVPPVPVPDGMQIDRKRLQKLREKKIALGHKPDDHEEEQSTGSMTMGGW